MEPHPLKRNKTEEIGSHNAFLLFHWPRNTVKISPLGRVARLTDIHFLGICVGDCLTNSAGVTNYFVPHVALRFMETFSGGLQKVPFNLGKRP